MYILLLFSFGVRRDSLRFHSILQLIHACPICIPIQLDAQQSIFICMSEYYLLMLLLTSRRLPKLRKLLHLRTICGSSNSIVCPIHFIFNQVYHSAPDIILCVVLLHQFLVLFQVAYYVLTNFSVVNKKKLRIDSGMYISVLQF
jgi:hypothetical protein